MAGNVNAVIDGLRGFIFKGLPECVVERLSQYTRYLEYLYEPGVLTVSSKEIAENAGVSPVRVRKDFSYIGKLGVTGVGYNVSDILSHLQEVLGLKRQWPIVVIGAGQCATALCHYWNTYETEFKIVAICEKSTKLIGKRIEGVPVLDITLLPEHVKRCEAKLGVIIYPEFSAQEAANHLVTAGIKGILTFSPETIKAPDEVIIKRIDMSSQLKLLAFEVAEITPVSRN